MAVVAKVEVAAKAKVSLNDGSLVCFTQPFSIALADSGCISRQNDA